MNIIYSEIDRIKLSFSRQMQNSSGKRSKIWQHELESGQRQEMTFMEKTFNSEVNQPVPVA